MRRLEALAADAFDRRLERSNPAPIAVAFSGGGDSLALTLIADAWARAAGRQLVILTVDHQLQAQSRVWTETCRQTAARLGRPFRALAWAGEKPAAGLPAAARAARHRLLADAAREAGANVILMGHTADDGAEAQAMRDAGSTTPTPRVWAPSPAWPEGRGVFLLRPLLGARRAEIRAWLEAREEHWIDDPANDDLTYARSRARRAGPACIPIAETTPLGPAAAVEERIGILTVPRAIARTLPPADLQRLIGLACVCAGGGERRPGTDRLERLAARLRGPDAFTATIAGARVLADDEVLIGREPGEAARGGLSGLALSPGVAVVWDGRFEIVADGRGLRVERLAGRQARLSAAARRGFAAVPAGCRGALPAIVDAAGEVRCPVLESVPGVAIRSLVGARLRAASGLIDREGA